ncbi:MAG: response regulator [Catalinimonas sp.]
MVTRPILIVEDSDEDYYTLARMLKKADVTFPLVRCVDGANALDYLHGTPEPHPLMMMLDLNLPGVGGRELMCRLREESRWKTLPVIIFSSSRSEKDVADSYACGANAYMTKPLGLDDFLEQMRTFKAYWLETVILPNASL